MSIIPKLATSLNRRDEIPNIELAAEIAQKGSKMSVGELTLGLSHKVKAIRYDCIKVLYEIGKIKPALISDSYRLFVAMLESSDNRMQWGAMTALACLAAEYPREIYTSLEKIAKAADKGSVITRDQYVNILITLSATERMTKTTIPLLFDQLRSCPVNQLPMYAENSIPVINNANRELFIDVLSGRLDGIEKESGRKRVAKVIKKVSK